jgi:hypothetical protein
MIAAMAYVDLNPIRAGMAEKQDLGVHVQALVFGSRQVRPGSGINRGTCSQ